MEGTSCFFCRDEGHKKKHCTNYQAWHAKKSILFILIFSEVNLILVSRYSRSIDSGAIAHISVSMQGCLSCRKPSDRERYIYVDDEKTIEVEIIEKFILLLKTGFYLDLDKTFIVPSF